MSTSPLLRRIALTSAIATVLMLVPIESRAQTPWTGIIADEARTWLPGQTGLAELGPRAISGDGQFVVFRTDSAIIAGDTNGLADIFVRDRLLESLTRVSVSSSGEQANGESRAATISRNGRYVAFQSCATNLVADDTNGVCDVFVRDLQLGVTTMVSVGPEGESLEWGLPATGLSMSSDGRYVVFAGQFVAYDQAAWLRDRDGDGDGEFDEPGESTTTRISPAIANGETLSQVETAIISGDGRWVAFPAGAFDVLGNWIGMRMFVHDRNSSTTVRVDAPPSGEGNFHSGGGNFSDTGEFVYYTSVPGLVPADTDVAYDVFVVDLSTLQHTHIEQTHDTADPYHWYEHGQFPDISADGRYVVYQGNGIGDHRDVYGIDRQTNTSVTLNRLVTGELDHTSYWSSFLIPSISADGLGIAFEGTSLMVWGGQGSLVGIFVSTTVDVPEVIDIGAEYGEHTFELTVPPNVSWKINDWQAPDLGAVMPTAGNGPETIQFYAYDNYDAEDKEHILILGSRTITIRQAAMLDAYVLSPSEGPNAGGTEVTIQGTGFRDGATVTFNGIPATQVTWISGSEIRAVTPAYEAHDQTDVVVTNPSGASTELADAFYFHDVTPPAISVQVYGDQGSNGWYISPVVVLWDVVDSESSINVEACEDYVHEDDTTLAYATCHAESDGGSADQYLAIKRDTVPPTVSITVPAAQTYLLGSTVTPVFSCGDATSGVVTCASSQTGALDTSSAEPHTFTVTATDAAGHTSTHSVTYIVGLPAPTITWTTPTPIAYPSTINSTLNATASAPGTFAYSPGPGTILGVGTHTLSVTFTPVDSGSYSTASGSVTLTVTKGTPSLTWQANYVLEYGTPLPASMLSATANVPGSFAYSHSEGAVLQAGTYTISVTFTPSDTNNYNTASRTMTLAVTKAMPDVEWYTPGNIVWGTPLGAGQQNAFANVPGTYTYTPPAGTILEPGLTLMSVSFAPDDTANYISTTRTVWQQVNKATPVITWSNPAPIVYDTVLGSSQNNATANVAGTMGYFPVTGSTLPAGTHTLQALFHPSDQTHYSNTQQTVTIVVDKRTPIITWNNPASIVYGTALSATQNNATADVSGGSFSYAIANDTVLEAGAGQTLSVTYSAGSPNYNDATASVTIDVTPAAAGVTWSNPSSIAYGTALGAAQLNASSALEGSFTYSPAAGTVLNAGTHTLSVTFTPASSNYSATTTSATIVVSKASTTVSWSNPAGITYGTALSGTQLNATASVPGSFAYSPSAGTVLGAGTHALLVTFTPADVANYNTATGSASIVVNKATPNVTWSNPAGITYGTALSGTQLNASAGVPGSFAYSPAAGTVLGAGTQTLSVTFTPTDAANYNTAGGSQSIAVATKALTVTANNSTKVYGQALPAFTVNGTGFVNGDTVASLGGTLSFSTSATATSAPGNYTVTPSGASSPNYAITFAAGTLTVSKANTTVTLTTSPSPSNNNQSVTMTATVAAVAPGAGTPTGSVEFRDNGTLIGTATLVNGVATFNKNLKRGSHPLTATYVASTNFNGSVGSKTHQVN